MEEGAVGDRQKPYPDYCQALTHKYLQEQHYIPARATAPPARVALPAWTAVPLGVNGKGTKGWAVLT